MSPQPILFAALDGLLQGSGDPSFEATWPVLEFVKRERIPLILCSSKTRAEIEPWRKRLEVFGPFVSENGGGAFIPYDSVALQDLEAVCSRIQITNGYFVLVLGMPRAVLAGTLDMIKAEGFEVKGFGDMDVTQVMQLTGLNRQEATRTMNRDFEEPFLFSSDGRKLKRLFRSIQNKGLRCAGSGPFYHLTGRNDMGKAVELLSRLYAHRFGSVATIGIGDSRRDLPMLAKVDVPVLVRNHRGEHDAAILLKNLVKIDGVGPAGWREALVRFAPECGHPAIGGASGGPGERIGTA